MVKSLLAAPSLVIVLLPSRLPTVVAPSRLSVPEVSVRRPVAIVAPAKVVTPDALFMIILRYVPVLIDCEPVPFRVSVLVPAVNVPVPVKFPPKLIIEFPVQVNAFSLAAPDIMIPPLTVKEPVVIVKLLSLLKLAVLAKFKLVQLTIPVPIPIV